VKYSTRRGEIAFLSDIIFKVVDEYNIVSSHTTPNLKESVKTKEWVPSILMVVQLQKNRLPTRGR